MLFRPKTNRTRSHGAHPNRFHHHRSVLWSPFSHAANSNPLLYPDRGGTFCDVWARTTDGSEIVFKLLSVDPTSYPDAPTEGIRRVLEQITAQPIPKGQPLDGSLIESVRIGTTVATKSAKTPPHSHP